MAFSRQQIADTVAYFNNLGNLASSRSGGAAAYNPADYGVAGAKSAAAAWNARAAVNKIAANAPTLSLPADATSGNSSDIAAITAKLGTNPDLRSAVEKSIQGQSGVAVPDQLMQAIATAGNNPLSTSIAAAFLQKQGGDQGPTNPVQWLLNLMAGGDYASARVGGAIGDQAQRADQVGLQQQKQLASGDIAGYVGTGVSDTMRTLGDATGGLARGIAEGFGARFDGEKPKTWGQNLDKWFTVDGKPFSQGIASGLEGAGVAPFWAAAAGGTPGLAADIALDPLTWLTAGGTGIASSIQGGLHGALDAAHAAADGSKVSDTLAGLLSGAKAGRQSFLAEKSAESAKKALDAAVKKGDFNAFAKAGGTAENWPSELRKAGNDTAAVKAEQALPAAAPDAASVTPADAAAARISVLSTIKGRVADLLPKIKGEARIPVDAAGILVDATRVASKVPADHLAKIIAIARGGGKDAGVQLSALAKHAETKALLTSKIKVGSAEISLGSAIQQTVKLRASLRTAIEGGPAAARYQRGLDLLDSSISDAVAAVAPRAGKLAQSRLLEAISSRGLGSAIAQTGMLDAKSPGFRSLLDALAAAPKQADKQQVLLDVLGIQKRSYETFDQALAGVRQGEVNSEAMREMLNALGISSKATRADTLAKTLLGKGAATWDEVKASVPSEAEVLSNHGIDAATVATSETIDVPAEVASAADRADMHAEAIVREADAQELTALSHALGVDASTIEKPSTVSLPNPKDIRDMFRPAPGQSTTGAAIARARLSLGKQISDGFARALKPVQEGAKSSVRPLAMSSLDMGFSFGQVMQVLGKRLHNMSGAERFSAKTLGSIRSAMRVTEDSARAIGVVPREVLPGSKGVYIGLADVLDALPNHAAADMLGAGADHSLVPKGSFGVAPTKQGFTITPTTMMRGAAAAQQAAEGGGDATAAALKFMLEAERKGAFEKTQAGVSAMERIAGYFGEKSFTDAMTATHHANLALYTKVATGQAALQQAKFGARLIALIKAQGSEKEFSALLRKQYEYIQQVTKSEPDMGRVGALAGALSNSRMDNLLIDGFLGNWGHAKLAHDGAAAVDAVRITETAQKSGQKVADAATKEATVVRKKAAIVAATPDIEADLARRAAAGELIGEGDINSARAIAQVGVVDAVGRGRPQTMTDMALGVSGDMRGLRAGAERESELTWRHLHDRNFDNWINGKPPADESVPGGLRYRLATALGQDGEKTSLKTLSEHMRMWHGLLDNLTIDHNVAKLQDGQIATLLSEHLNPTEAQLAIEYLHQGQALFGDHALASLGVTAVDMNHALSSVGVRGLFDETKPLHTQGTAWLGYGLPEHRSAMDMLTAYSHAVARSTIRPNFAASLSHGFSHTAEGISAAAAKADGWVRLWDPQDLLRSHFPKGEYFHPSVANEVNRVSRYLNDMEKPAVGRTALTLLSMSASIWKPLYTIWRPGHHVTNFLGTALMAAAHGYNYPAYMARAIRATHEAFQGEHALWGGTAATVEKGIADLQAKIAEAARFGEPGFGQIAKADVTKGSMTLRMTNGASVTMDPAQIASWARSKGLLSIPHDAANLSDEGIRPDASSLSGFLGTMMRGKRALDRTVLKPFNTGNRVLSSGASIYENTQRLAVVIQLAEKRAWANLDQFAAVASNELLRVIPTREALGVLDRKYGAHLFGFYTWVRGALGSVARLIVEHPGYLSIPSKMQYNQANAAGFDPESFGKPFPAYGDPNIASYFDNGVYGPMWTGGLGPLDGGDNVPPGETPQMWGLSLSAPQLDALTTFLGLIDVRAFQGGNPLLQAEQSFWSLVAPPIKVPVELGTNSYTDYTTSKRPMDDPFGYLWQQTGVLSSITNSAGITGLHPAWTNAENAGDVQRKFINFLSGLKLTDYNSSTSARIGQSEFGKRITSELQSYGLDAAEIKAFQHAFSKQINALAGFRTIPKRGPNGEALLPKH